MNSAPLVSPGSATLSTAFEGWKRARNRSPRTAQEYEYAIKLFGELHGDIPLAAVRKSHARQFREALQAVPIRRFRTGKLQTATLPELATWGRAHTNAQKIGAGTMASFTSAAAQWRNTIGAILSAGGARRSVAGSTPGILAASKTLHAAS